MLLCVGIALSAAPAVGGDWPMWRYDAGRTAATPDPLPEMLHVLWTRELPPARTAWPASQTKLQFDASYEPIVAGKRMFVGSTVNDSITAYDTESGDEIWRFYTDGPVRFAPVAHQGRVYAVSDDGHLYCLDAAAGAILWKVNGGPSERRIIGNERLISTWPARGGPVVADGKVFFTAGIWPSMGIFIHAVDADSGRIVWTNSETGSAFVIHPHGARSFGSVVPQGHLAVAGKHLIVPGGRSLPAVFETETGKFLHFQFGGKSSGGHAVMANDRLYIVGNELFRVEDGASLGSIGAAVLDGQTAIADGDSAGVLIARSLGGGVREVTGVDRKGKLEKKLLLSTEIASTLPTDKSAPTRVFLKAGDRVYTGGKGQVAAFRMDLNSERRSTPAKSAEASSTPQKPVWSATVEGDLWSMLAADDKLFVVTKQGTLSCFGAAAPEAVKVHSLAKGEPAENRVPPETTRTTSAASAVTSAGSLPNLKLNSPGPGYAIIWGLGAGARQAIDEILEDSPLDVVAVDRDASKVEAVRRQMDARGVYGSRVAAHVGDPRTFAFPSYLAQLIICAEPAETGHDRGADFVRAIFEPLRPYGGTACFRLSADEHATFETHVKAAGVAKAEVARMEGWTLVSRVGPLPGAADWTHQYADAANSVVSKDRLVKAPLGVLWFGGPSNDKVLPRHGHGPSPQVAGGRLFIEGPDMLRAQDVYTGRLLWEKELKGLGAYYDTTSHFPGAGEIGSNYVSLPDRVYVVYGNAILELDAATGTTLKEFASTRVHGEPGASATGANWGFIAVWRDLLIAAAEPVTFFDDKVAGTLRVPSAGSAQSESRLPDGFHPLIKPHERWKYLAGTDPAENWTAIDFDDRSWKTGEAGFGYDDNDDRTVLKDMEGNYTRVYIRKEFDGGPFTAASELALMINYDDGFIAYLNGTEISRSEIKSGSGPNVTKVGSHGANGYEMFPIKDFRKLLRSGRNVIAIEGHNTSLESSDFSLDPYLAVKSDKPAAEPAKGADAARKIENSSPPLQQAFTPTRYSSGSRELVVFDRHTGKRLWGREAVYNFRHNSIAAEAGKVFCIDGLSPQKMEVLKRRGIKADGNARLLALDAYSGKEIWSTGEDVFGTFVNYSADHDVLLQAGSAYRDRAKDEVDQGMVAYRGRDGKVLWKDLNLKHGGPVMLWRDKIITNGGGGFQLELLTGQPTGWTYQRMYGCNTAVGSEHLLTFRSGAAGFCDLTGDSGTGNIGGFRSSCTANLIAADGVLNAPDYTRTCVCAYQNQTSLALIHMPDAEMWTFSSLKELAGDAGLPARLGLNLGGPGDRRDDAGTLWFEYPSVGGPSPKLEVEVLPKNVEWFRRHSSQVASGEDKDGLETDPPASRPPSRIEQNSGQHNPALAWVAASGVKGVQSVTWRLSRDAKSPRSYTVRLHFAEPDGASPGQRVFHVAVQGQLVLKDFDVSEEAGPNRAVVKEFRGTEIENTLNVRLTPSPDGKIGTPVLCGIEVIAENVPPN